MPLPIQETYIELRKSFAKTQFQAPSYPTGDKIFNDLYDLCNPLTEKEINAFISRLEKINPITVSTDSLENKLYQFIASSHFSYFYGNFCRKNPIFSLKKKTIHKTVSHLLRTQCTRFNDALLKASLKEKKVIDITEMYMKYLIKVEESTLSTTDKLAAGVTGFDLDKTQKEAKKFRLELQQRLSDYQSTLNPTPLLIAPLLKKEEGASKPSAEIQLVLLEKNTLTEKKDVISPLSTDNKPETTALQKTNGLTLEPVSEKPKQPTTEANNKSSSGFIDYLMKILRTIVQLVSTLIHKLRFHADTPSSAAPKTPVIAQQQEITSPMKSNMANVNSSAHRSPILTMHWQKAKQKITQTENPNASASSTSLNNRCK